MDNVTDRLLPNPYPFVTRATMIANQRVLPSPVAEHGFSVLLVANPRKESLDSENKVSTIKVARKVKKQIGEYPISQLVKVGGFKHFKRATQTPFNLIYEAKP